MTSNLDQPAAEGPAGEQPTVTVSGMLDTARHANPPNIVAHELEHGSLAARGVSFRGSAHALTGEPRQDSFALATSENWLIAVVSDGIGSCAYSQHGSAAAANAVATALALGDADPADGQALMKIASRACIDVAERLGVEPNMVAATLTLAAVEAAAQPDGSRHVLLHAAGDSPVLLLRPAEASWHYLTPQTDLPCNVVEAWVPERYDTAMHAGTTLAAGEVLVVCSDGFSIPLGEGSGPLGKDLARRWAAGPRGLMAFLVDLSFQAHHDDKTAVAIWNSDPAVPDDAG